MGNDPVAIVRQVRMEAHPQEKDLPVVDVMSGMGNECRQQLHLLSQRCDIGHQRHQAIFGKNGDIELR